MTTVSSFVWTLHTIGCKQKYFSNTVIIFFSYFVSLIISLFFSGEATLVYVLDFAKKIETSLEMRSLGKWLPLALMVGLHAVMTKSSTLSYFTKRGHVLLATFHQRNMHEKCASGNQWKCCIIILQLSQWHSLK